MNQSDTGSSKPVEAPATAAANRSLFEALRVAVANWWGPGPSAGRKDSSHQLAEDRTDMATSRTLMAADRTLMAWVRTSLSLSSFGFTIYKVLQGLAKSGVDMPRTGTPKLVGLFLTGLGTLAIVMGIVEYANAIRELRAFKDIKVWRAAFVMALLMAFMGITLFVNIYSKVD
jgi:putative membrane protein